MKASVNGALLVGFLVLVTRAEAHPGAIDSGGGHFTDPIRKTGYHRHSSPLYRSNYSEAALRRAEADRRVPLRARSAGSEGIDAARPIDGSIPVVPAAERVSLNDRVALLKKQFVVVGRWLHRMMVRVAEGAAIPQVGAVLAVYRIWREQARLIGRAKVYYSSPTVLKLRIISWCEDPDQETTLPGEIVLSSEALPAEPALSAVQFASFLRREPWGGMPLEIFLAAWGQPVSKRERVGQWGSSRTLRYRLRNGRRAHYHFRNGRLVRWKER